MMRDREFWDAQAKVDARKAVWSEAVDRTDECVQFAVAAFSGRPQDGTFLDLGCGCGRVTIPLAQAFPDAVVYGIDISPEMIDCAIQISVDAEFSICDDGQIPFPDDFFDGIFSMLVFQHLTDEQVFAYLTESQRTLATGGVFCFQFVTGHIYSGHDRRRSLQRMTELAGFAGFPQPVFDDYGMFPEWAWMTVRKHR